jgi:general nucleoside transport system permease protein
VIEDLISRSVLIGIAHSGVRLATPYLFAALGETFAQRSGVLNLGVDGIMLMGAFAAFYVVFNTGNLWLGVLAALLVGAVMGLLMALVSVTLKAKQGISGIGLYLFGLGMSSLLFKTMIGSVQSVSGFGTLRIPGLSTLPIVGQIFFNHNVLTYVAYLLVPAAVLVLNYTTFGLKIRAVGHNPQAADSLGVNVDGIRYLTLIIGAALAGLAGASLSIGLLNIFQENMTNGLGFIAVALVYFGGWRPLGVLAGALLFSTVNALQLWVQVLGLPIPSDVAVMLPYLLTIAALAFAARQIQQPAALTKPYERGE